MVWYSKKNTKGIQGHMTIYKVSDIYSTIQGEGCQTGTPMVLLRLQGCGVGCPWCDTRHTWSIDKSNQVDTIDLAQGDTPRWTEMSSSQIAYYIAQNFPTFRWVLVTGGEPAEQDLEGLVNALHDTGRRVALETSGTEIGLLNARFDWVCVSPKIKMPGGKAVLPGILELADEIKHVVGKPQDVGDLVALLDRCALRPDVQICLQPVSMSPKATALCVAEVQKRNWRLSIQTHKITGVR